MKKKYYYFLLSVLGIGIASLFLAFPYLVPEGLTISRRIETLDTDSGELTIGLSTLVYRGIWISPDGATLIKRYYQTIRLKGRGDTYVKNGINGKVYYCGKNLFSTYYDEGMVFISADEQILFVHLVKKWDSFRSEAFVNGEFYIIEPFSSRIKNLEMEENSNSLGASK